VSRAADTEEREAVERERDQMEGGRRLSPFFEREREGEWRREKEAVERESSACARGRAVPEGVVPGV
jgi:hypothetical protein